MSQNIDFTTFDFSNALQVGSIGGKPVYLRRLTGAMPTSVNAWRTIGNIGAYNQVLMAQGVLTSPDGLEQHVFPGGTKNTEMNSIYYQTNTGEVRVQSTYSWPLGFACVLTVLYIVT